MDTNCSMHTHGVSCAVRFSALDVRHLSFNQAMGVKVWRNVGSGEIVVKARVSTDRPYLGVHDRPPEGGIVDRLRGAAAA